ncbi:6-carboxytetrahydropterin synthase [Horticoccus luteus]|uniref:6-carboxy-5,6,7,8-tetrahydropterin synthase n=1 Tax=Horticoccus luteus TaxID=2862869 RepID=A0A8F9TV97_9BACT|nr:6-carboxytetrahydropterin synthase [Horticoccus luteus]QYM78227.1 6-carboxytetrahydropterin synthase [Horticoccus luteus]
MPRRSAAAKSAPRPARAPAPRVLPGTVYITRQVHFNAAHRLHNPSKSQKWNEEKYGLCTNPHWHGHNYVLEVTVAGEPQPDTGYVLDLAELKRVLQRVILDRCDHRNLNEEVEFLQGLIPSTENLAIAFWNEIEPALPAGRLHRLRLYETPRNFVEYFGAQAPAAS